MNTRIYILINPSNNEIRYIGKTKQKLEIRLRGHIRDAYRFKTKNGNWIKSLLKNDLYPKIEELDLCDDCDWEIMEKYWISQFKSWGFKLNNMTDGGDGNQNQKFTEESQKKKSESLKKAHREGRFGDENTRKKQSEARKGWIPSKETREKLRLHNLGKKHSEESKSKKRKKVFVYDKKYNLLNEFDSVLDASIHYECRKGSVSNACLGRSKLYGLIFKYDKIKI